LGVRLTLSSVVDVPVQASADDELMRGKEKFAGTFEAKKRHGGLAAD
jgi:hypothetical protein